MIPINMNRRRFLKCASGLLFVPSAFALPPKVMIQRGMVGGRQSAATEANLVSAINSWQADSTLYKVAGLATASFADNAQLGNTTGGRTFVNTISSAAISYNVLQHGFIKSFTYRVNTQAAINCKAKIFRPASGYDFVSESEEFAMGAAGANTQALSTPMAAAPGDVLSIFLGSGTTAKLAVKTLTGTANIRYTTGDITANNAFSSTLDNFLMCFNGSMTRPFMCITGDSIAEGHSNTNSHHSLYDSGPSYNNLDKSLGHLLRAAIGDGSTLRFQNRARGSQEFSWVASTGAPDSINAGCKVLLIHCGVNDISNNHVGVNGATIIGHLNTIKALMPAGTVLLVDEVFPWTGGTDDQAATVRAVNGYLAAWCAANNATLIHSHDSMGQIRAATGFLDDLKTEYNSGDNIHLNAAGYTAWAAIIKESLIQVLGV